MRARSRRGGAPEDSARTARSSGSIRCRCFEPERGAGRLCRSEDVYKRQLTKGADTSTEKARRLYDYVARNVRYVSISLGVGRYQPHSALDVLQYGYGDCKDKHTLFSALLRAEGIQSYPVLIDSSRKLDADVPSPAQFDHVITAARLGTGTEPVSYTHLDVYKRQRYDW